MNIDATSLITNTSLELVIDEDISIDKSYLENTPIRDLQNIHTIGKLTVQCDGNFLLKGEITGTMILADDFTLEDVKYDFTTNFEEIIEENELSLSKTLDILPFLWQNILTEVPMQVGTHDTNITKEGRNWRVISEDELEQEGNNPFKELQDRLDKGKE